LNFSTLLKNTYIIEAAATWRDLTNSEIKQEWDYEYDYVSKSAVRNWTDNAFQDFNTFKKALKDAQAVTLTKDLDARVSFRSRTDSITQLKNLVSSYAYPRDVDRIVDGFKKGVALPYPIILKRADGSMRVLSGNTRLDVAFILGYTPKVLMVEVPKFNQTDV